MSIVWAEGGSVADVPITRRRDLYFTKCSLLILYSFKLLILVARDFNHYLQILWGYSACCYLQAFSRGSLVLDHADFRYNQNIQSTNMPTIPSTF